MNVSLLQIANCFQFGLRALPIVLILQRLLSTYIENNRQRPLGSDGTVTDGQLGRFVQNNLDKDK